MKKNNFLNELIKQLTESLPTQLGTLKKDFEKNCKFILSKTFSKFDLVTREEFDTQSKVLLRTRKKCEELEKEVEALERLLKKKIHE